ncbi:hypothetical protein GN958_ATG05357 [Phytophthora infestans]|uniref:Uncharacterized protein n=1 Tax=Phytophthora infestans TaxID=4787 RepID=A0A8S9V079_PHYIN|nr:hypothetical protein GN958_ATG05357 [Phytophthora infestans]
MSSECNGLPLLTLDRKPAAAWKPSVTTSASRMVRLQRSELPHETLRAGDFIQYYSRALEREAAETHAPANSAGRAPEAAPDVCVSSTTESSFQPPAKGAGERTDASEGPASEEEVSRQLPMEIPLELAVPNSDSGSVELVMNATSTPSTTTVSEERSVNTLPVPSHSCASAKSEDSSPDNAQPSESTEEMLDPKQYLAAILTRLEGNKIRHQAKKRSN